MYVYILIILLITHNTFLYNIDDIICIFFFYVLVI